MNQKEENSRCKAFNCFIPGALFLIIFRLQLEICLRMIANRANLRGFFTDHDVPTVAALPDAVSVA